jgi:beta-glucanase (GH16 family)
VPVVGGSAPGNYSRWAADIQQGIPPTRAASAAGSIIFNSSPASSIVIPDPVGQPAGAWHFAFGDEFTTGTLDRTKWDYGYPPFPSFTSQSPGGRFTNNVGVELEAYDMSAISFDTDGLVLSARYATTIAGLPYTSGMISSYPAFTPKYGYFEARMKLSGLDGTWPAFWLTPATDVWPPEIDIIEQTGNVTNYYTITSWRNNGGTGDVSGVHVNTTITGWHVYGLKWTASGIVWYLDGVQVGSDSNNLDNPTIPMVVVVNHAVKGSSIDHSAYPAAMHVDYVRCWS